jgi:hypothetical protein
MDLLHMLLLGLVVGLVVAISLLKGRDYIPYTPPQPLVEQGGGCGPVLGLLIFVFLTLVVIRAVGLPQLPIFSVYG